MGYDLSIQSIHKKSNKSITHEQFNSGYTPIQSIPFESIPQEKLNVKSPPVHSQTTKTVKIDQSHTNSTNQPNTKRLTLESFNFQNQFLDSEEDGDDGQGRH